MSFHFSSNKVLIAFSGSDTELIVPENVFGIGKKAFYHNVKIESIKLPRTLSFIDNNAFESCFALTSITIPSGVKYIGKYAFSDSGLKTLILENGLKSITANSFKKCRFLSRITLPDTLFSIGDRAFESNVSLTNITLPPELKHIGKYAFADSGLVKISCPKGLKTVSEMAFAQCRDLVKVTVYDKTKIYKSAFCGCDKLKELVMIDDNGSAKRISADEYKCRFENDNPYVDFRIIDGALEKYLGKAQEVRIPETVNEICPHAFRGDPMVKRITVGEGTIKICDRAFTDLPALEKVDFPKSLRYIGEEAFARCVSLKEIVIEGELTTIDSRAFMSCQSLTKVVLPRTIKTLGQNVFCNCTLRIIDVEPTRRVLQAFKGQRYFPAILFTEKSNVEKTTSALKWLKGYRSEYDQKDIVIEYIRSTALPLTTVVESDDDDILTEYLDTISPTKPSLKELIDCISVCNSTRAKAILIDYQKNNYSQADVDDYYERIRLAEEIEWIKASGTYSCTLQEFDDYYYYERRGDVYAVLSPKNANIQKAVIPLTVDGVPVTIIGANAFSQSDASPSKLHTVYLPQSLTTIEAAAFKNTRLSSIALPQTLRTIGKEAFADTNIEEIVLPPSIEQIGASAFEGTNIKYIDLSKLHIERIPSRLVSNCVKLAEITLGDGIRTIDDNAFESAFFGDVCLPSGVETIGEMAFGRSKLLSSVDMSRCSKLKVLSKKAFYGCSNLKTISLPDSLERVDADSFGYCAELRSISLGDNVFYIGASCFGKCQSLISFVVPPKVTEIAPLTFNGCFGLEKIVLSPNTETISAWAFCDCGRLRTVEMSEGLKRIEDRAFENCAELKTLVIPKSVEYIASDAFEKCDITLLGEHDSYVEKYVEELRPKNVRFEIIR